MAVSAIHASPDQIAAMGNLVMLSSIMSFCMFALMGVAIACLRAGVTNASFRTPAIVLGAAAAFLAACALYDSFSKGHIVGLGNILLVADLYYMFDLYAGQDSGFVDDGTKTAASILIGINELFAVFSLVGIFAAHDIVALAP
jgi:hypothetical protein